MRIDADRVAVGVHHDEALRTWLYSTYLPRSGYVPAEQPPFEAWDGEPFAHGTEHLTLRLQLAVVEAR